MNFEKEREREKKKLEGSTVKSVIFFTVLCGNLKIHENTVLDYKKGTKFVINMIFEKFRRGLYKSFVLHF